MKITNELIHIKWDGPFSLSQAQQLTEETDFGIYQIYGDHVVYGRDVLLYIGMAQRRKFGQRIPEERWDCMDNIGAVSVCRGRLAGSVTPVDDIWNRQIELVERILIYAHFPAYNTQKNFGSDPDLQNIHIVNLGFHRSLLPEVSGTRWAETVSLPQNFHEFDTRDIQPEAPNT